VSALDLVAAAGLGLGLGGATSMSPAVINVSIVDAAAAGRRRFATGLGLGGAAADVIHAALAFSGVGRLMTADPRLVHGLAIAAAAVIVGYAVMTWRRRRATASRARAPAEPAAPSPPTAGGAAPASAGGVGRGIATGFMLTLPNPAALGAWVAVAAAVWRDAELPEACVIAGGVGAGSALWFTLLARWISGVRRDHPALAIVPRVSLIVLLVIAAIGVARAL
jgi:threonine/homoserine/homoserine lactone efflux protein